MGPLEVGASLPVKGSPQPIHSQPPKDAQEQQARPAMHLKPAVGGGNFRHRSLTAEVDSKQGARRIAGTQQRGSQVEGDRRGSGARPLPHSPDAPDASEEALSSHSAQQRSYGKLPPLPPIPPNKSPRMTEVRAVAVLLVPKLFSMTLVVGWWSGRWTLIAGVSAAVGYSCFAQLNVWQERTPASPKQRPDPVSPMRPEPKGLQHPAPARPLPRLPPTIAVVDSTIGASSPLTSPRSRPLPPPPPKVGHVT
jgi:hypothetical protein